MGAKLEGQWKDNTGKRRLSKVCITSGDQQLGPVPFGTLKMSGAHIESVHMYFPPVCTRAGQALVTCKSQGPRWWDELEHHLHHPLHKVRGHCAPHQLKSLGSSCCHGKALFSGWRAEPHPRLRTLCCLPSSLSASLGPPFSTSC